MLETLDVRNLAVIRAAQAQFGPGLNILTGETGAGKSVILGGVNLALGEKASRELIRNGAKEASCELVFRIDDPARLAQLREEGFEPEDGALILSRRIRENRSICRVGGEMVPAAKLREISAGLIDIHGQRDSRFLLNKKYHLNLLDAYDAAESADLLTEYRRAYDRYRSLKKELSENDRSEEERLREISFLEFEINEITSAGLSEGEDEELEESFRGMSHAQQIGEALYAARELAGSDGASDALNRASREVSAVMRYGADLETLYDQMAEVSALLDDLERSIRDAADAHSFDAQAYEDTRRRLDEINHLKRKYGRTVADILQALEEKQQQLKKLKGLQEWKERTAQACEEALNTAREAAARLTRIRRAKAEVLEEKITQTLLELNFPQARFRIEFREAPLSENGADSISFLISTNPGEALKPLEKVASGGELSRIMLALRTVSALQEGTQTLIFDEIDSGISGRTAQKVGELLKKLSKTNQIICITHLPQIAAMADRHYLIEKTVDEEEAFSSIRLLEEEESIEELSRMLGGARITDAVLRSAREMKQQAVSCG